MTRQRSASHTEDKKIERKNMLKVEEWPIDRLVPYARNPRKNDPAVTQMMSAIQEFGFRIPVVAKSDGSVVDGHLRLKAAKKLGLKTVPVALADELTEAQVKAFRLLANQSANWAEWDNDLLKLELEDLTGMDYDISGIGFDDDFIDELMSEPEDVGGEVEDEDTPDVQENAVTQLGDIWLCGEHRVMCGDSTSEEDVSKLLAGETPVLMVTDPPYGVEYDPNWRVGVHASSVKRGKIENDDKIDWHAGKFSTQVDQSLETVGFKIVNQIIWAKNRMVLSRGDYHWQHEPCFYVVREGKPHHYCGDRKQTTLWEINQDKNTTGHGSQSQSSAWRGQLGIIAASETSYTIRSLAAALP